MTWEAYRAAIDGVIWLTACALHGTVPDAERVSGMNLSDLLAAAGKHQLTAAVGMALQDAGIRDGPFAQAVAKAQRKSALLDADSAALYAQLERMGIWYMPLKGAVLKSLYPRYGMREMADVDVLVDPGRAKDVRTVMENLGFSSTSFGRGNHDVYRKPPVSHFEIHTALFGPVRYPELSRYYLDVKSRLVKDEGNRCGWHFRPEDLYIHITAHEFKHYNGGGTGLRSLADMYLLLKKAGDSLDFDYIGAETEKLGIAAFERQNRSLAAHLFDGAPLTAGDQEMLEYMIRSGTYGTVGQRVEKGVKKLGGGVKGKLRYLFRRLFPPMASVRISYPFFARHRILLPFLCLYRNGKGLIRHRKMIQSELRALIKHKK